MIFTQWQDILEGRKTETRRLIHPQDITSGVYLPGGYKADGVQYKSVRGGKLVFPYRYYIGQVCAVVPKRSALAIWLRPDFTVFENPLDWLRMRDVSPYPKLTQRLKRVLLAEGFLEMQIIIRSLRPERLQDITEDAARAEGAPEDCTNPIGWYAELWNRVNPAKAVQWDKNPEVWAIKFDPHSFSTFGKGN